MLTTYCRQRTGDQLLGVAMNRAWVRDSRRHTVPARLGELRPLQRSVRHDRRRRHASAPAKQPLQKVPQRDQQAVSATRVMPTIPISTAGSRTISVRRAPSTSTPECHRWLLAEHRVLVAYNGSYLVSNAQPRQHFLYKAHLFCFSEVASVRLWE